jgi:hypothetical protein
MRQANTPACLILILGQVLVAQAFLPALRLPHLASGAQPSVAVPQKNGK